MKPQLHRLTRWASQTYQQTRSYSKQHPRKAVLFGLAGIAILAPIVNLLVLLVGNSVNIPFWDQWIYVDLVSKWHHGNLGIGDLWHQHNEHRIMIPKLFQILLGSLTGWNIRAEVMMNFLIGVGSFSILVTLLRRTFGARPWPILAAAFITAWLFFSPVQYINWIWGFQLAWFFSVLAIVGTIWALTNYDPRQGFNRWFIVAVIGALVATFSMGNGMLVWIIGLGYLLYLKAGKKQYGVWSGVGIAAIGLYFYHLVRPEQPSPLWLLRHRLGDLVEYTLQYLGRNLAFTPSSAKDMGIVLLVLLAISLFLLARKKRLSAVVPWLAIGSYGLLTAALAAYSRMYTFGVDHSMTHSYTTMSVLFVIGTLVTVIYTATLYLEKIPKGAFGRYLVAAFTLGAIAFPVAGNFWYNYTEGARELKGLGLHFTRVRDCVFTVETPDDPCLDIVYPMREQAWDYIGKLKDMNWDHLRDESPKTTHPPLQSED